MTLTFGGVLLYLVSAGVFFLKTFLGVRVGPLPFIALVGGMGLYLLDFISTYISAGRFPVGDPYGMVSLMGNTMVALFLITNGVMKRSLADFGFIVALVGFFTTLAGIPAKKVGYPNPLYAYHILSAGVAYASLILCGFASLVKMIVERKLRAKHIEGFMVPVNLLRKTERILINVGFIFLTLTLIFGSLWAKAFLGSHWINDPKLMLTMGLWAYYALVVHLNLMKGLTPSRLSLLSLTGALMVIGSIAFIRHTVS
ncbi:MAG: cytochrome c biogenesis protein CcsA [Aquificota bacterium]|nr:cytochrome c biogenesis protein CcsA [Aquificota bacterium]